MVNTSPEDIDGFSEAAKIFKPELSGRRTARGLNVLRNSAFVAADVLGTKTTLRGNTKGGAANSFAVWTWRFSVCCALSHQKDRAQKVNFFRACVYKDHIQDSSR